MERMAVYGTLISTFAWMKDEDSFPVWISGYRRVFNSDIHTFPFIIESKISGFWYLSGLVSEWEIKDTDRVEQVPKLYERKMVDAKKEDGTPLKCWIYIPTPETLYRYEVRNDDPDEWMESHFGKSQLEKDFPLLFKIGEREKTINDKFKKARDKKTDGKTLDLLAREKNPNLKWLVARNENTPPETLKMLSKEKKLQIRRAIIYNKNSTEEILKNVLENSNDELKKAALEMISLKFGKNKRKKEEENACLSGL